MQLFVTGIGTEIGKTVTSAVLVQALGADYFKPVQAGDLDRTDSDKIREWTDCRHVHPEAFRLHTPMSPHAAADIDGVRIDLTDIQLPTTENDLVVEGAGGLFVPLNHEDCIIDLIAELNIPVVLVSRNYLGSINHTLLSINALQARNIPIFGLIFNGKPTPTTEEIIVKMTGVPVLGRVEEMTKVNQKTVAAAAAKMRESLKFVPRKN